MIGYGDARRAGLTIEEWRALQAAVASAHTDQSGMLAGYCVCGRHNNGMPPACRALEKLLLKAGNA